MIENHMVLPHAEPEEREPTHMELSLEREVTKLEGLMAEISNKCDYLQWIIEQAPEAPVANANPGELILFVHRYRQWLKRLDENSNVMP